jgi:hypothetical protein
MKGPSSPTPHHPHVHQRPAQGVHERRERPHVIGQFLALVPEGLNLGMVRGGPPSRPPALLGLLSTRS